MFLIGPAIAEPLTLDVAEATVVEGMRSHQPEVEVRLAERSRKAFADFSVVHLGKKVDFRIDGKSVLKPVIQTPIAGGVVILLPSGLDEAQQLATRLSSKSARFDVEAVQ